MLLGLKFDCWKFWNEQWEAIKDFDENDYDNHYKIVEFTVKNIKTSLIDPNHKWREFSSIVDYFREFKKNNINNVIQYAKSWNSNWHSGCRDYYAAGDLNRASKFNY